MLSRKEWVGIAKTIAPREFARKDVDEMIEDLIANHGPLPKEIPYDGLLTPKEVQYVYDNQLVRFGIFGGDVQFYSKREIRKLDQIVCDRLAHERANPTAAKSRKAS
jgi:hypothetical protein